MGTSNSSEETKKRAADLASAIGWYVHIPCLKLISSYHTSLVMDDVVSAVIKVFTTVTSFTPKYKVYGGSNAENLALQNIQVNLNLL